jgi:ribosome biogenesis GTPase
VTWRQSDTGSVIERVFERSSTLSRPDNRGNLRPIAANIDRIAIVIAAEPKAHANLIDRYLVASALQKIEPFIIVNKIDLLNDNDELFALARRYESLGYTVFLLSATSGDGIEPLKVYMSNHTSVLVGQSGVGKSSIINSLYPQAEAVTGSLSEQAAKGRHTTTTSKLYRMPEGGLLLDSPGIREFGLWHLDKRDVANGFIEFEPFLGHCRFRDCLHLDEPGCAILDAIREGSITLERHLSYQQIVRELIAG